MTVEQPHGPEDSHPPAVALDEAAQILGLTEAAVLMRVFQRSLPSSIDRDGVRRVPREAVDTALTIDGQDRGRRGGVGLPGEAQGWWSADLRDARERIAALESQARDASGAMSAATTERWSGELRDIRERVAALEAQASEASAAALATVEALAGELRAAHARIAALESQADRQPAPAPWRRVWAICVRLVSAARLRGAFARARRPR